MPKCHNIFSQLPHRGAVIDADPGGARHIFGLVHDDHWQVALERHVQVGVVVGDRVDNETVHPGVEHRV